MDQRCTWRTISSNDVSVIDTTKNTVIDTVKVGTNPSGVAVSPDGSKVYVANYGNSNISVIDTSNNTVTATVPVGVYPAGVAVNPTGNGLWRASAYIENVAFNSTLSVIDTSNNTVRSHSTCRKRSYWELPSVQMGIKYMWRTSLATLPL